MKMMKTIKEYDNNNRITGNKPKITNSKINFLGENNLLICEDNVKLTNSEITFNGNDSIIYLSSNKNDYHLSVTINNESVLYIDENCYFNDKLYLILSETKNIIIGKECLFSFSTWVRLADPHLIYNSRNSKRINLSKSVYIGDHVWIGQDVLILKGTTIGSGSIIGAKSVIANKKIPSNTIWGGNPAKEIKKNIFFDGRNVHKYTKTNTEQSMKATNKYGVYKRDKTNIKIKDLEAKLETSNFKEKINILIDLRKDTNHNRFYIR